MSVVGEQTVYWSLFVAAMLPYAMVPFAKAGRAYDNAYPRDPACYDTPFKKRAQAAHYNAMEALTIFAPAVLLALWLRTDMSSLAALCTLWVGSRTAYAFCYLAGYALPRSLFWLAGWGITIAIFVLAIG